jgi:hypothetical protein
MRPGLVLLCLFVVFLDVPNLIAEDPLAPWNASGVPQTERVTVLEPPPPLVDPYRAVGPQQIETELFLGLPTEIRTQWAYLRGNNAALMLEGIVGVEPLPRHNGLFPLGLFGVGGRLRLAAYNGERNAFVLKPGMDVYGLFAGSGAGGPFEGADVELLWWHNCGEQNRFGFVLGADIGCLIYIGSNLVGVIPQVSGIFGLHF